MVSLPEGLQEALEQLLGAPTQKLAKDVVEEHFGLGDFAAEPEEVVFPEGHLKLAVVFEEFHLLLNQFLPPPQPAHHHSPLQLPQHLPRREPGIQAGQLGPNELAVVCDPGEDDVARAEAGPVPFGGPVEIEGPQCAISGSVDVDNEAVGSLGLDDADEEVILLREVGGHLLAEVKVALGSNLVLDHQPVVETLEMPVFVDKGLGVGLGVGQVDFLVWQHHPVVELFLHYQIFLIYDSSQITNSLGNFCLHSCAQVCLLSCSAAPLSSPSCLELPLISSSLSARPSLDSKTNPFCWSFTNSGRAGKLTASTGMPAPNISTTFMGRSNPELEQCRQIPRSQIDNRTGQSSASSQRVVMLIFFHPFSFSPISPRYRSFQGPFPVMKVLRNTLPCEDFQQISRASSKMLKSSSFVQEVLETRRSQSSFLWAWPYFSRSPSCCYFGQDLWRGLSQRVTAGMPQLSLRSSRILSETHRKRWALREKYFSQAWAAPSTSLFLMLSLRMVKPQL